MNIIKKILRRLLRTGKRTEGKPRLRRQYEIELGRSFTEFLDIEGNPIPGSATAVISLVDKKKMNALVKSRLMLRYPHRTDIDMARFVNWDECSDIVDYCLENHFDGVKLDKPKLVAVFEPAQSCVIHSARHLVDKSKATTFEVPRAMVVGDILHFTTGSMEWSALP